MICIGCCVSCNFNSGCKKRKKDQFTIKCKHGFPMLLKSDLKYKEKEFSICLLIRGSLSLFSFSLFSYIHAFINHITLFNIPGLINMVKD